MFRKYTSLFIVVAFMAYLSIPPCHGQNTLNSHIISDSVTLPVPGSMVHLSPAFTPVLLKGLIIRPDNPLEFDFIIDSGNTDFTQKEIKQESKRLVKYFLASMTVPKNDLWVNLSPYEDDRIIPEELGRTELGRDLLAQDYILKQLTSTLMHPDTSLGKKFWDQVYAKSQEKFGDIDIPLDTFNKVWIVPEKAVVYENGDTVYIVESRLKVLLDQDYLALEKNQRNIAEAPSFSSQIIREIILPEIEREVNEGKNFTPLRQIYHSLILSKWYKQTVKNSLLSQVYVDQNKVAGLEVDDKTIKDKIYQQYMSAYQQGVFNFIREDYDALSQQSIPRQYFSGGFSDKAMVVEAETDRQRIASSQIGSSFILKLRADIQTPSLRNQSGGTDQAMLSPELQARAKLLGEQFADQVDSGAYRTQVRPLLRALGDGIKENVRSIGGEAFPFLAQMDATPRYSYGGSVSVLEHSLEILSYIQKLGRASIDAFNVSHQGWPMDEELASKYRRAYQSLSDRDKELLGVAVLFHDIGVLEQISQHPAIGAIMVKDILEKLDFSAEDADLIRWLVDYHVELGTVFTSERSVGNLLRLLNELPEPSREKAKVFLTFLTIGEYRHAAQGRPLSMAASRFCLEIFEGENLQELNDRFLDYRIQMFSSNQRQELNEGRRAEILSLIDAIPSNEQQQFRSVWQSVVSAMDYALYYLRQLTPEVFVKLLYLISQIEKNNGNQLHSVIFNAETNATEEAANRTNSILSEYSIDDLTSDSGRFTEAIEAMKISVDVQRQAIHVNNKDLALLADVGGIDMNDINFQRQGSGFTVEFDPATFQSILETGIDGVRPVEIDFIQIQSIMRVLGFEPISEERINDKIT